MYRWHVRAGFDIVTHRKCFALTRRCALLCIILFDHAKAAKLPLDAIKVAMVVGVTCHETVAADIVISLYTLDYVHEKRELGYPQFPSGLVRKVKLCRRGIVNTGFGTKVVTGFH
jgi:hypothetical protein